MFSSKNFTESGLAFRFLICSELFLCMVLAVVQLLSHVRLFVTHGLEQPGFPVLHCLPEFVQILGLRAPSKISLLPSAFLMLYAVNCLSKIKCSKW